MPTGCKWDYTIMYTIYGSIEHYKVCSVARSYTQTEGKYFLDTFPPMSKLKIVRLLPSIIAIQNWSLQHLDIDNAFLHEDLHEEVHMIVPKGLTILNSGKVCRLLNSLYCMKQASRHWYAKLSHSLI